MRQFILFFRKEMLEMGRSYKWLWVPIIFLLLGVMQPVINRFMPEIMKSAGNLPKGMTITVEIPSGAEVLAQTLGQYNSVGLLILVLSLMTMISGERRSGVSAMIFSKPVSFISYVAAKWASMLSLVTVSFVLGYAGAWYYTVQMIGTVNTAAAIQAGFLYLIWMWFAGAVTLFVGSFLNPAAGIAFVSLGILLLLTMASGMLPFDLTWSPGTLPQVSVNWLQQGSGDVWSPLLISILCMVLFFTGTVFQARRRQT
ncbi:ABC transporter permease subunit [Paenibacillus sp.]|jgi:ABC-2 type transport system permease protein|uniref:ABC transporter permease n=1 Tax=Paenibacillus sp. TaxID=58172 RepID=UPI0028244B6D|nr:ABC transporter permease subunit [Paenibacillus sp.]MDR0266980.1 ABC transporter permease [Paenibacillus sp.]